MTDALFGLLGVITGAALTAGVEHWRDVRAGRQDRKVAVRLAFEQLTMYAALARLILDDDEMPPADSPLVVGVPTDLREALTVVRRDGSLEEWQTLYASVRAVDYVRNALVIGGELNEDARHVIESCLTDFQSGLALFRGQRI
ncbi:MAG: hypothetical protein JWQ20_2672 [Conexibacter sp.]|nr:hypothetical protein [Conexibacter sp.]